MQDNIMISQKTGLKPEENSAPVLLKEWDQKGTILFGPPSKPHKKCKLIYLSFLVINQYDIPMQQNTLLLGFQ